MLMRLANFSAASLGILSGLPVYCLYYISRKKRFAYGLSSICGWGIHTHVHIHSIHVNIHTLTFVRSCVHVRKTYVTCIYCVARSGVPSAFCDGNETRERMRTIHARAVTGEPLFSPVVTQSYGVELESC